MVLHLPPENPIHRVRQPLRDALAQAQGNLLERQFRTAGELFARVLDDARLRATVPGEWNNRPVGDLADQDYKDLLGFFGDFLRNANLPAQVTQGHAVTLAERVQLVTAFEQPDAVIEDVRNKVSGIVGGFPRSASDIQVGKNPGDVLDPYILAATQILMFGGDFEPTIQATVAHKAMMMIEGLLGHLHEDVVGKMRGNIRAPEPRGDDQETLDVENNPFPGADVIQPPQEAGQGLKFHQLKSKTGSAKGGDGRRLGEQLNRLRELYGGEIFYHALIGNTLRGHRSRAGVERAAPGVVVLVGEASFKALTGRSVGPQLLLRLYQSAFKEVSQQGGYRVDTMAAAIVATFQERAEQEGEGFLEVILHDATRGNPTDQDNRLYQGGGRGRGRRGQE